MYVEEIDCRDRITCENGNVCRDRKLKTKKRRKYAIIDICKFRCKSCILHTFNLIPCHVKIMYHFF